MLLKISSFPTCAMERQTTEREQTDNFSHGQITVEERIDTLGETAMELAMRAVIDVGSGDTKITVAQVHKKNNRIEKIWHQSFEKIELRKSLAAGDDGCLSPEIENKLIESLKKMKSEAHQFDPKQWAAIGTSVFRKAKNCTEFLERVNIATGVEIRFVPQHLEGEIGFANAIATSRKSPEEIIAWDSGAGSFQISSWMNGGVTVYGAEFAYVASLELLFEQRKQPFSFDISPNPVSSKEALDLIEAIRIKLPAIPTWLAENNKQVIAVGGSTGMFSIAKIATKHSSFTKEEVKQAIFNLTGKTDKELVDFPRPDGVVVGLIFLYAMMEHCGIAKVTSHLSNGVCEGVLIMPRFWV